MGPEISRLDLKSVSVQINKMCSSCPVTLRPSDMKELVSTPLNLSSLQIKVASSQLLVWNGCWPLLDPKPQVSRFTCPEMFSNTLYVLVQKSLLTPEAP